MGSAQCREEHNGRLGALVDVGPIDLQPVEATPGSIVEHGDAEVVSTGEPPGGPDRHVGPVGLAGHGERPRRGVGHGARLDRLLVERWSRFAAGPAVGRREAEVTPGRRLLGDEPVQEPQPLGAGPRGQLPHQLVAGHTRLRLRRIQVHHSVLMAYHIGHSVSFFLRADATCWGGASRALLVSFVEKRDNRRSTTPPTHSPWSRCLVSCLTERVSNPHCRQSMRQSFV